MAEFYIGLGSNLGDRLATLEAAVAALAATDGLAVERVSSVYETEPVGGVPQGDYLNLVVGGVTALSPEALLARCLEIEKSLGRVRDVRWGPRTIDLDVLWYEGQERTTPELQLPHPRMLERAFVLVPLSEIAPGLWVGGKTLSQQAAASGASGVRVFSGRIRARTPGRVRFQELPRGGGVAEVFAAWRHRRGAVWLDSARVSRELGRYSLIACEPELEFFGTAEGTWLRHAERDRFLDGSPWERLREVLASRRRKTDTGLPLRGGLIGYATYESGLLFEGVPHKGEGDARPLMRWSSFEKVLLEDHLTGRLYAIADTQYEEEAEAVLQELLEDLARIRAEPLPEDPPAAPSAGPVNADFDREGYFKALANVRDYIAQGDVYQVNLTRRYRVPVNGLSGYDLHRRLRGLSPAPYSAYLKFEDEEVVSSSPELFLRVKDGRISTRPIKGTRPRSADPREDARLAKELQESAKDRAELLMIVDLERNDLGRVCVPGSVSVTGLNTLESHPTVHHLVAEVSGRLKEGCDVVEVFRATFPGGSITGAPKVRAMQIIHELEPCPRGVYTGVIGYVSFQGDAELNIAIRTVVLREGEATLHAGSGVVWDSAPSDEFAEVHAKARAMLRAVTGLEHREEVP